MDFNIWEIGGFRTTDKEQLDAHHSEESTSPWNSPVFVVKKKSVEWRLIIYLRAVNTVS